MFISGQRGWFEHTYMPCQIFLKKIQFQKLLISLHYQPRRTLELINLLISSGSTDQNSSRAKTAVWSQLMWSWCPLTLQVTRHLALTNTKNNSIFMLLFILSRTHWYRNIICWGELGGHGDSTQKRFVRLSIVCRGGSASRKCNY